jgi:hypothetical protein
MRKGDAECKYWLHSDRVDSVENFEYNCTPRMTRGASAHLEHFDNAGFGDLYNAGQPSYIQFGVKLYF